MNSWKPRFSLALAAAILVSAPGLPSYEAAAQVVAPVSAHSAPSWLPVVSAVTAKLQASPSSESADALRMLGQARLELALNPQAASALLFVSELPSQAADPAALARYSEEGQAQLISQAARRASEKLSAEAATLLQKSRGPQFSAADRKRLQEISASWFYLPQGQAVMVREFAPKRALSLAKRISSALGGKVNAMIGGAPSFDPAVAAESRLLFADAQRAVQSGAGPRKLSYADEGGKDFVEGTLAPYSANALAAASDRLRERGVPYESLSNYLLSNHRAAFGWDAQHALIKPMRSASLWTEFASAVSLQAAERLSKSSADAKVAQILKKAGADYDLRLPIPSWHPLSGQAESVAAWLSTKYGAPSADPLGKGLRLGKMFGVPVLVTPGAFAAMALFAVQIAFMGHGHIGLLGGAITSLAMYAGVLGHEIGHALAARHFDTPTSKIELNLLGGGAFITHEYRKGWPDFLVAIAGPIVTLALAFLPLGLAHYHLLHWLPKAVFPGLNMFVYFNLLMGVMNMLPLLPMDGGRMLRGALTGLIRDDYTAWRATRLFAKAANKLGMWYGFYLILTGRWALALAPMMLGLIAGMGAGASSAHPGTKLVADKPAKK